MVETKQQPMAGYHCQIAASLHVTLPAKHG